MSKQIRIPVDGGHLAAIDHGGPGRPMLLVHGSGHNAAAWNALAAHLAPRYRIVALDLRGHGQSTAESTTAEQYWRDLAAAVARSSRTSPSTTPNAAGVTRPAAVTAVTAYPPVECPINSGRRQPSVWITVEQVGAIDNDWLNAGAQPALVREVASRCLLLDGAGRYLRRPTTDEIAATTAAERHTSVYPSVDVYDRITCPMVIVLPSRGFYAHRRDEIERIVTAAPGRRLVDIDSNHNTVMTKPAELAAIIATLAEDHESA